MKTYLGRFIESNSFIGKKQYSKIQNYQNLRTDFVREVSFLFQDPIYLIRKPKLEFDQFCFR